MPVLTIYTNLKNTAIPETFVDEVSEVFAKAIGKAKEVSSSAIFLPGNTHTRTQWYSTYGSLSYQI